MSPPQRETSLTAVVFRQLLIENDGAAEAWCGSVGVGWGGGGCEWRLDNTLSRIHSVFNPYVFQSFPVLLSVRVNTRSQIFLLLAEVVETLN